ncbi:MAG: hypothetical protein HC829_04305, partial [Bacteroidales bacterium]|nr:hypothetical protein [Bacteroidales bacterium]
ASITNNNNLSFYNASTADNASITNNKYIAFGDASTAGNASITNNYHILFRDTSTAGNASITNNSGSVIDFSESAGAANDGALTAGSIAAPAISIWARGSSPSGAIIRPPEFRASFPTAVRPATNAGRP